MDLLILNGNRMSLYRSPRIVLPLMCLDYVDTVQFQYIFKMIYCRIFNIK
jgi:hypothetical protein